MSQTVNVNPRLAALTAAGTSPWLDQIRRSLTQGGELRKMVEEDSLRGVTSNPAIFEKAILGSPDYDEQIEELARTGALARAIYQEIAIQDVQEAADVLRSVFDDLGGDDGYVSLEVDPDLAFDSDRTIAQAREYWAPRRPPQRDDQDPRHVGVPAGDRAGDLRGHQHQRDAAVLRRGLRRRWPRPTSRASSAATPRARTSTCARWRRSSSRAWTPRSTSAWRRSAARTCRARRPWPTRAPPTGASRRSSAASASRSCAAPAPTSSGRCGLRRA